MSATDDALYSFVDESMRSLPDGQGIYVLAAVICEPSACADVREELRRLLKRKQQRLHWRDESASRRSEIATTIGKLDDVASMVVVGAPMDPTKPQDRARRLCMEALYPRLSARRVGSVVQERRTPSQDRNDMGMVDALRGKRLIPARLRIDFAQPKEEPMLWIPDAVAVAVGHARAGDGAFLDLLRHSVTGV